MIVSWFEYLICNIRPLFVFGSQKYNTNKFIQNESLDKCFVSKKDIIHENKFGYAFVFVKLFFAIFLLTAKLVALNCSNFFQNTICQWSDLSFSSKEKLPFSAWGNKWTFSPISTFFCVKIMQLLRSAEIKVLLMFN